MAANLTPQYMEADKKLRTAKTPQEKIEILEEMLSLMPKHKATEKLQAQLKSKISKLKEEMEKQPSVKHGTSYVIPKQGAGQIAVVGPPNSGKSMLIKALTGAEPEVGDYPFTTRAPAPYMMKFENVRVQLVDQPPLTPDIMESWQIELIKVADAALLVVDLANADSSSLLESLIGKLKEKKVEFVREDYVPPPESPGPPPFKKKTIIVANKSDLDAAKENLETLKFFFEGQLTVLPVSAEAGDGLEDLKKRIFGFLHVIRVYSKAPGKKPDNSEPFVLKRGTTVIEMARAVHKDFAEKLAYARLWRGSEFTGQMINREFVLEDKDVCELHL
ncbi:MAG: GTPase [Candidatus Aminicenantales bacterium]